MGLNESGTSLAADFNLPDECGNEWRLSDHRGRVVVLIFYPGDETPVCTRQMCSVRDRWDDYVATGAEVVGISTGTVEAKRNFVEHHKLPFRLLADPDRKVIDAFGVRSWLPGRTARSVIVVDPKGNIRYSDVRRIGILRQNDDDILAAIQKAKEVD